MDLKELLEFGFGVAVATWLLWERYTLGRKLLAVLTRSCLVLEKVDDHFVKQATKEAVEKVRESERIRGRLSP